MREKYENSETKKKCSVNKNVFLGTNYDVCAIIIMIMMLTKSSQISKANCFDGIQKCIVSDDMYMLIAIISSANNNCVIVEY